jgi:hypothetical protein
MDVAWEERSIVDDPELRRRYGEQIPVTFVDGPTRPGESTPAGSGPRSSRLGSGPTSNQVRQVTC